MLCPVLIVEVIAGLREYRDYCEDFGCCELSFGFWVLTLDYSHSGRRFICAASGMTMVAVYLPVMGRCHAAVWPVTTTAASTYPPDVR